jgi:hypothetical protein
MTPDKDENITINIDKANTIKLYNTTLSFLNIFLILFDV